MDNIIRDELEYFKICVIYGFIFALYYDGFRIIRRLIKHRYFFVTIEDVVYGIFIGIQIFLLNFNNNNGVVRIFMFLGLLIGSVLYHKIFSTTLVKVFSVFLGCFVDKILKMLIIFVKFTKYVNKNWKRPKKIRKN